ncbi:hypothetical protein GPECTOR_2g1165 [Gonium pectorale]|uniref:Uncharacterized protein n=1 Tax=Gonium pectorale TaxID=33097 RepID=A0A150H0L4_GONPE|nr:hypothetical protein GPECTOR_2g1165 [Gonium pectorale]|eukprot:KXZ55615.1 hypothetical protein GPECTOR_2g1165 [Gonium pectorale]
MSKQQATRAPAAGAWRSATIVGHDEWSGAFTLKYHHEHRSSHSKLFLPLAALHFARLPPPPGTPPRSFGDGRSQLPAVLLPPLTPPRSSAVATVAAAVQPSPPLPPPPPPSRSLHPVLLQELLRGHDSHLSPPRAPQPAEWFLKREGLTPETAAPGPLRPADVTQPQLLALASPLAAAQPQPSPQKRRAELQATVALLQRQPSAVLAVAAAATGNPQAPPEPPPHGECFPGGLGRTVAAVLVADCDSVDSLPSEPASPRDGAAAHRRFTGSDDGRAALSAADPDPGLRPSAAVSRVASAADLASRAHARARTNASLSGGASEGSWGNGRYGGAWGAAAADSALPSMAGAAMQRPLVPPATVEVARPVFGGLEARQAPTSLGSWFAASEPPAPMLSSPFTSCQPTSSESVPAFGFGELGAGAGYLGDCLTVRGSPAKRSAELFQPPLRLAERSSNVSAVLRYPVDASVLAEPVAGTLSSLGSAHEPLVAYPGAPSRPWALPPPHSSAAPLAQQTLRWQLAPAATAPSLTAPVLSEPAAGARPLKRLRVLDCADPLAAAMGPGPGLRRTSLADLADPLGLFGATDCWAVLPELDGQGGTGWAVPPDLWAQV